jgi:hypothetical protein
MSDSNSNSGGIGLAGATFIVFLVLKLTHTIDWSWWWVTAPLWIPTAVALLLIAGAAFVLGLVKIGEGVADKKAKKVREARRADRLRRL